MTAAEQYDLSHDTLFMRRVQMIAQKTAIAVAAEDPATASHAQRVAFGNKVLMNPSGYAELIAQGVTTNSAINASSTDSDIEFTINSQWNAYAIS
jgi:hypothetical protein